MPPYEKYILSLSFFNYQISYKNARAPDRMPASSHETGASAASGDLKRLDRHELPFGLRLKRDFAV